MKTLICTAILLLTQISYAKSIESFRCSANWNSSPGYTISLTYPWGPSNEKPVIYCDATDGYWHSCAQSIDFTETVIAGNKVLFGGPNLSSSANGAGVRIELDQTSQVARFCVYRNGPFATAACEYYEDVAGTGRCTIKWK
jgi:hypothetical protein